MLDKRQGARASQNNRNTQRDIATVGFPRLF